MPTIGRLGPGNGILRRCDIQKLSIPVNLHSNLQLLSNLATKGQEFEVEHRSLL
jgi:hypothetical protein